MTAYKKLKKSSKLVLMSALAAGALAFAEQSNAQQLQNTDLNPYSIAENLDKEKQSLEVIVQKKEEKTAEEPLPIVRFTIGVPSPLQDSDSNSIALYTANQLLGRGSYMLGRTGVDDNLLGRIGILVSHAYLSYALATVSHEFAHIRVGEKYGDVRWSFELRSLDFGKNFPKVYVDEPPLELRVKEIVAGLNQDELNAKFFWFKNNTENFSFNHGISFLFSKLSDTLYNLTSKKDFGNADLSEMGDVNAYLFYLQNIKRIDFAKREHLMQALLADILSVHTWDSVASAINYLATGKRSTQPTTFKIGQIEIVPPLFGYYIIAGKSMDGPFYDVTSILNPKGKNPIELNFGTSSLIGNKKLKSQSSTIQNGDLRLEKLAVEEMQRGYLRIGAQYHNIKLTESRYPVIISPFAYMTMMHKPFSYEGFSAGTEIFIPIKSNLGLVGKGAYSRNDLENLIKDRDNGLSFFVGVRVVF